MTSSIPVPARTGVHELDPAEAVAARDVARRLVATADGAVDDDKWISAARAAWEELPLSLRHAVRSFRRHSGSRGTLLLRGLPVAVEELPATPGHASSVQREATVPAALIMAVASGLGDPIAFAAEKSGAMVQDVVPVPGREEFQGNAGSVRLSFHNENAFHPHRPDYVLLICLRPDHDRVAGTSTASVREVLPLLSAEGREALHAAEFTTAAPPSFGGGAGGEGARAHAVLTGPAEDPDLRVDLAATRPLTGRAERALAELADVFETVGQTQVLTTGDLVIVDNRIAVHGRSRFTPRYDGSDRWLQRTFVAADVRRCRAHRAGDGNVLS
ncbi:TauD/TfdA family dioxygenase [Streptomyces sp. NBC_00249]|uniref:TauD/TfdA family dioxygenase n=1 Tax=Streptomyces sp. NBC_00249 TaxID=2975690 RepID=UPI002251C815|nr:TauD/TfdA family dioxygenase [Streptomyces sp. NBC_00249]MCX5192890.1 TauD/TfdA family dioxygenase [Streptomyces sp. NBC_00249]